MRGVMKACQKIKKIIKKNEEYGENWRRERKNKEEWEIMGYWRRKRKDKKE